MKYFLSNISVPLIIFTEKKCLNDIISMRKNFMHITIIIVKDFTLLNEYSRYEMWKQERSKDPEKKIHTPALYIIWNEKLHFIKEAHTLNPFQSECFIWMDIGAFRNEHKNQDLTLSEIRQWPSLQRIHTLPKNKMIITKTEPAFDISHYAASKNNLATLQLKTHNHVGAIFIIPASIIPTIHTIYYQLVNERQKHGLFVGKEQNTYACMSIGYPQYIHLLHPPKDIFPWYYMHHYLSDTRDIADR